MRISPLEVEVGESLDLSGRHPPPDLKVPTLSCLLVRGQTEFPRPSSHQGEMRISPLPLTPEGE